MRDDRDGIMFLKFVRRTRSRIEYPRRKCLGRLCSRRIVFAAGRLPHQLFADGFAFKFSQPALLRQLASKLSSMFSAKAISLDAPRGA